jgi:phosphatidate cytidylyltransferase
MFGGKAFGGPKMAPVLSPNKTWSGSLTGLFASVAVSVIYAATILRRGGIAVSLGEAVVGGVVVSAAGQLGDLAESLFKREAGAKDSSTLLPGHGGVLDRLDSLYFALPVSALLFIAFGIVG